MPSEANANDVFSAMPLTATNGNGLYDVIQTSGPYSRNLTAADAVGTTRYPYLRSCEPAYIPVLYKNVGTINGTIAGHTTVIGSSTLASSTTITGVIGSSSLHANHPTITGLIGNAALATSTTTITGLIGNSSLHANHPTITGLIGSSTLNNGTNTPTITGLIGNIAITGGTITQAIATLQSASASSGCDIENLGLSSLDAIPAVSSYTVSVVLHTTVISSIVDIAKRASYTYNSTTKTAIAIYDMGAYRADLASVGCSKTVMFTATDWVNDSTSVPVIDLGQLAFLYAGDNNNFIQNGQRTKFYQFLYIGDFVTFQMLPGTSTGWLFVVTNYNSTFTNTINVNTPANIDFVNNLLIHTPKINSA